MQDKDYGVHIMTEEEWKKELNSMSDASKEYMNAEAEHQRYMRRKAEIEGKLQDEEWMTKL